MSVVVGDERPGDGLTGLVVVPDGGGHGQDALGDAGGDAFEGPAAVGFEVELVFEGVVDRFDQLADGLEQRLAVAGGLVFAAVAQAAEGEADPPVLAVEARQRLGDGQADQLGLAEAGRVTGRRSFTSMLSVFTYSAVSRVSKAASMTGPPVRRLG